VHDVNSKSARAPAGGCPRGVRGSLLASANPVDPGSSRRDATDCFRRIRVRLFPANVPSQICHLPNPFAKSHSSCATHSKRGPIKRAFALIRARALPLDATRPLTRSNAE